MAKEVFKNKEKELLELTGKFCSQKLNEEYLFLCSKLINKLGKQKEVPFKRGKIEIWAAAIIYAVGSINFLFDKSFEPYISTDELNTFFGTKKTTVSNKARQIKDMFDMWHFSPEFSTQNMEEKNPFNNMVMVDGLIVPLSSIPEDLQEMVKKERAEGRDIEFTSQTD
nr:DUF6398 domain-containing protein [uncultured Marinifilum sp.]